ncbi:MAG TPA: hypothetical protein VGK67_10935 [Myxococcales bacterium]
MQRVFLLSPATCGGQRARLLLSERASFPLALRLRSAQGVPLGEAFAFLSGLYFRGKLAYARAFARPPARFHEAGVLVITPTRGLLPAETAVGADLLREFAQVDVRPSDPRYCAPLARDTRLLATALGRGEAVLLGSLATGKYLDVLAPVLEGRLVYPRSFLGRGDLSRGALLLRCARRRRELVYEPVRPP